MLQSKLMAALSWTLAGATIAALVYYTPLLFIGLLVGYALGKYNDEINSWLDDNED